MTRCPVCGLATRFNLSHVPAQQAAWAQRPSWLNSSESWGWGWGTAPQLRLRTSVERNSCLHPALSGLPWERGLWLGRGMDRAPPPPMATVKVGVLRVLRPLSYLSAAVSLGLHCPLSLFLPTLMSGESGKDRARSVGNTVVIGLGRREALGSGNQPFQGASTSEESWDQSWLGQVPKGQGVTCPRRDQG